VQRLGPGIRRQEDEQAPQKLPGAPPVVLIYTLTRWLVLLWLAMENMEHVIVACHGEHGTRYCGLPWRTRNALLWLAMENEARVVPWLSRA